MRDLKQWALPAVTVLAVLGAVLLPRQISSLRDRSMLGAIHTEALSQEDLSVRELPLPEKLELLGRAIRYPDLEIFSTMQPLPAPRDPDAQQASEAFFQSAALLADWGILPEGIDPGTLEFQGGSRVVYVRSDGYQSVSLLYLQGIRPADDEQDNFWLVVDEESGLPVWIDCILRSSQTDLTSEDLGTRFLAGLNLETQQRGPALWEICDAGGLMYSAQAGNGYGRICVEPIGFAGELFGETSEGPTSEGT